MNSILLSVMLTVHSCFITLPDHVIGTFLATQEEDKATDLILALDEANTLEERQKITSRLIKLGAKAIQSINSPPDGLSRQTELLLERIKNEIEKKSNSQQTTSTRFSLVGEFQLKEALKSIQTQTGIRFTFGLENAKGKTFNLKDVEFWHGMDQVLDAYGLDLKVDTRPGELHLKQSETSHKRTHNSGYTRLLRSEIVSYSSGFNFRQRESFDKLKVEIRWEPTQTPIQLDVDYSTAKITGPDKKTYKSTKADQTTYQIRRNQTHALLDFEFARLPRNSESIQSVQANLVLTTPVGKKDFVFADILTSQNKSVRHADMRVAIDSVSSNDDKKLKVGMTFFLDNAGDSLDSHRGWMFQNVAQIIDKKGIRYLPSRTVTNIQKKDKMGFNFLFEVPNGPDGCKFVYRSPTSIQKIPIAIEIKNIELDQSKGKYE